MVVAAPVGNTASRKNVEAEPVCDGQLQGSEVLLLCAQLRPHGSAPACRAGAPPPPRLELLPVDSLQLPGLHGAGPGHQRSSELLQRRATEGGRAEYGRAEPESVRGVYCRPRCRVAAYGAQSSPASVAMAEPSEVLTGAALQRISKVDKGEARTLLQACMADLEQFHKSVTALKRGTSWDMGIGQPYYMYHDTGKKPHGWRQLPFAQSHQQGPGTVFKGMLSGVGLHNEAARARVTVPKLSDASADGIGAKSYRFTGFLRPHLYPVHDKPMIAILDKLSLILSADELSYIKVPGGQSFGREDQLVKSFVARKDHSETIEDKAGTSGRGRMGVRNRNREEDDSVASEILAYVQRMVHPSQRAFAHPLLPHYGLGADKQMKQHLENQILQDSAAAYPTGPSNPRLPDRGRDKSKRRRTSTSPIADDARCVYSRFLALLVHFELTRVPSFFACMFSEHSPAQPTQPAQPAGSAVFPGWSEPDTKPLPQPSEENLFTAALAEDVVGVDQAVATIKVLDATRKLAVSQLPQAQQDEIMVSVAEHALRASLAPKESDEGGRGGAG